MLSRLVAGDPPGCSGAAEIRHDLHRGRSPRTDRSFHLEPRKHVLRATSPGTEDDRKSCVHGCWFQSAVCSGGCED